ncbi:SIMPL domain-containing protein [Paenibacillus lutrae]|uniref:DUF541 domain-containing protein n=1 Tax=Paenibacillus lutrae TaxID=2078573 RepID=A0A7X3JXH7_9BACL|nr:SIMPL domain-containing protein [Paenibacillus lutrae]MVO98086.1 DUF541 domain-containing protein [Paenibacillus lutrae]
MDPYPDYWPHSPDSVQAGKNPLIEVNGQGILTAVPDRALIVLGAITEGTVLAQVQQENVAVMTRIINALKGLGIPGEHIQTEDFRIDMQYDFEDGKQTFRGYKVTHLLQVTTDRVGQTGTIVDTAVASGANTVNSIRFAAAKPEIYENKALSAALVNAQHKAATIARTLGVSLPPVPGEVEEITLAGGPVPYKAVAFTQSASAVTPIEPGEITFSAAVRVKYK